MRIVTRVEWGARSPKSRHTIALPTLRLWVHHTATEQHGTAGVRAIQAFHIDTKGWSDIAYSFLIDDDGTIYEGRGVGVAGAHTEGDNSTSHAICLMGNFENRPPADGAEVALVELARYGRDRGWWVPTLGGHRDAPGASTACPGQYLYAQLPTVRTRLNKEDTMDRAQEAKLDRVLASLKRIENEPLAPTVEAVVKEQQFTQGFLAVAEGFEPGDPVYYVARNWQSKLLLVQDGPVHNVIKYLLAEAGHSMLATRLAAEVLDGIPTVQPV